MINWKNLGVFLKKMSEQGNINGALTPLDKEQQDRRKPLENFEVAIWEFDC